MDDLFPTRRLGPPSGPEPTEHLDPLLERRWERRDRELRVALWQAWALAWSVFGEGVGLSISALRGPPTFRGLLNLSVPFHDLEGHRRRESIFLAGVRTDPVLSTLPLLFVFEAAPPLPSSLDG